MEAAVKALPSKAETTPLIMPVPRLMFNVTNKPGRFLRTMLKTAAWLGPNRAVPETSNTPVTG